ncbi:hypothetical protein F7984_04920 [Pradoshia sp. D12]|jgi:hypothetical protein|uniref:hypothetical protein n=1 Tax=Bacillaceae TaxID=186817 RepID=UPI00080AE39A|nr:MULTISPECIES: hypothetical protein [Bacillaceae]OCA89967.1 hypothetical protein A8L44_03290 [Bacillus sp. FJAT-27986]QFK70629.1 hypothetical protein F7984_04920 [Pradoshia sp. D12]TPF72424.1 hypothetical protein FHY44_01315 [Bacillus sp. D12]
MSEYILDFILVSFLIIGLTAFMGPLTNGIGNLIFGRHKRSEFVIQTNRSTTGFNKVGGKKNK